MDYDKVCAASRAMGEDNDCVVMALSMVLDEPYEKMHRILQAHGRKPKQGASWGIICRILRQYGITPQLTIVNKRNSKGGLSKYTAKTIGQRFPYGVFLMDYQGSHVAALIHGRVYDWTAGRRHRIAGLVRVS